MRPNPLRKSYKHSGVADCEGCESHGDFVTLRVSGRDDLQQKNSEGFEYKMGYLKKFDLIQWKLK